MNILIVDDEYYIVQGIVKIISESFTEFDCIYQALKEIFSRSKPAKEHRKLRRRNPKL